MKYKCLVLDHDDTVVNSTATIHYPCFVEYLEKFRPHLAKNYTLESYFIKNFHPGILSLLRDEVGLSPEEVLHEEKYWSEYVKSHIPTAYDGIGEIIAEFRRRGGIIAVDSHSYSEYIIRDYKHNGLPSPDVIYGWDLPKEKRKPAPDTLLELMENYSLSPSEILVVDDLKPGYDMARSAGAYFAAAGWAYDVREISEFMKKNCDFYLDKVEKLGSLLFD
jgi:phosphoglycolate phosphatase/pyrophosphatase PpaX